jgi:hypothetical protein
MAVCLFASNFLFWSESGYFAAAAELKPLLHTWSLAVEEQFYMLFPLLVMGLWRFGRRVLVAVLATITLSSLVLSHYGALHFANANFYMLSSRAWELFAGALAAFALFHRPQRSSELLAAVGLALILFSILAYDETTPFPSLYALAPVIGAVLIILFGHECTKTAQLLGNRVLVGIGLISYSAYLWHQPLFAFARIRSLVEPSPLLMTGLAVVSLALAYLSWRFVEKPFRKGGTVTWLPTTAQMLGATATAGLVFLGIGAAGALSDGFRNRFSTATLLAIEAGRHGNPTMDACMFDKGEAKLAHPIRACLTPHSTASKTILIGDSHAGAIAAEALKQFDRAGADLYVMGHSACVGFSGFYVSDPKYRLRCNSFFQGVERYIRDAKMDTVVMVSRWSLYIDGNGFDNGEGGIEALRPIYADLLADQNLHASQDDPARKARVLQKYIDGIQAYLDAGANVVLVYPIPEAGWNVPELLAKASIAGDSQGRLTTSHDRYLERNRAVIAAFDALSHPNLFKVRPQDVLCNTALAGRCLNSRDYGHIFYFDGNHPSDAGAALIVPGILKAVQTARENGAAISKMD